MGKHLTVQQWKALIGKEVVVRVRDNYPQTVRVRGTVVDETPAHGWNDTEFVLIDDGWLPIVLVSFLRAFDETDTAILCLGCGAPNVELNPKCEYCGREVGD